MVRPWHVLVALLGSGVALFVGVYVIRPRLILRDFDAFLRRHPVGTAIAEVGADPFVGRATVIALDERVVSHAERASLPSRLAGRPDGNLDVMWTHTPPFGRVSWIVRYEHGRIVDARTHDLD